MYDGAHSLLTLEFKRTKGLLTVYYLYTIDIVCKNLPAEDFNTLEYEEKKPGHHTVKYVHAWQWTPWDLLKLHLFEGSTCRERPEKFSDVGDMNAWLMSIFLQHVWVRRSVKFCVDPVFF